MTSQLVVDRDHEARTIWPEEAIDYLCANGEMLNGTIRLEGKNCCIVGALNLAAAKVTGKMRLDLVFPIPTVDDGYTQLVQVSDKHGAAVHARMRGMIRRWDVASARGRRSILDRMCGREIV